MAGSENAPDGLTRPTAHPLKGTTLLVDGEAVYTYAYIATAATTTAAATAKTSSHEKLFFLSFLLLFEMLVFAYVLMTSEL